MEQQNEAGLLEVGSADKNVEMKLKTVYMYLDLLHQHFFN